MLTQLKARQLFDYCDGVLYWKVSTGRVKAGTKVNTSGRYAHVQVMGERWYAHRLIFLWHYGYVPKYVDHINGNPQDNRIVNLRECTQAENVRNSKLSKRNTSGIKGVTWDKARSKWRAQLSINGVETNLGRYATLEEAAEAVRVAREQHHGDFVRHQ